MAAALAQVADSPQTAGFFRRPEVPIFNPPAQAGYGDKQAS